LRRLFVIAEIAGGPSAAKKKTPTRPARRGSLAGVAEKSPLLGGAREPLLDFARPYTKNWRNVTRACDLVGRLAEKTDMIHVQRTM
jgi:hypothetical protein